MTTTTISPTLNEAMVARHLRDDDDAAIKALVDAVKLAREVATKAATMTKAVLANELKTPAQRQRQARDAAFTLVETATTALDDAVQAAEQEIANIKRATRGPAGPKDLVAESRQRELRDRLMALPPDRRRAIIDEAIVHDDEQITAAVLCAPPWLVGLSQTERDLVHHAWARKHHAADLDRLERLTKAVADSKKAGSLAISYVDGLTDSKLIAEAEQTEARATAALKSLKLVASK